MKPSCLLPGLPCGCDALAYDLFVNGVPKSLTNKDRYNVKESCATSIPIPFLGSGASKVVFEGCKDHVIKLGYKIFGHRNQIADEILVWLDSSEETRKRLAPIIAYMISGNNNVVYDEYPKQAEWIIQQRADEFDYDKATPEQQCQYNNIHQGSPCFDTNSYENVGIIDGNVVIIDYGYRS